MFFQDIVRLYIQTLITDKAFNIFRLTGNYSIWFCLSSQFPFVDSID